MALDRQSIEKKDFPIGRRGYDPDAVDGRLRRLADEIDELKRSPRRQSESVAASAGEQVRSILEAAEASAAEIQHQAEDEARDYVGRVSDSPPAAMLERIDALQHELNALIESLRTGSNRLNAALQLLEGNLSTVKNAVVPRPVFEPDHEGLADRRPAAEAPTDLSSVAVAAAAPNGSDDAEGARLVALNMAMDGKSREETERYLAEHFRLTDRRQLLDDVYAALGG